MNTIRIIAQAAAGRVVPALAGAVLATAVINPLQGGGAAVATSVKEPLADFTPVTGVPSAAGGADDAIAPDAVDASEGDHAVDAAPEPTANGGAPEPTANGGAPEPTANGGLPDADGDSWTPDADGDSWTPDADGDSWTPDADGDSWTPDADDPEVVEQIYSQQGAGRQSSRIPEPTGIDGAPESWRAHDPAQAVNFAMAQIGKPYVYGATGPDSYDCSGLVQAAWASAGVTIPRTTYDQAARLAEVGQHSLQPGDLILYYGGSHVGLYVGGGLVVHAPTEGDVVKTSPYNSMPIWKVVRPD